MATMTTNPPASSNPTPHTTTPQNSSTTTAPQTIPTENSSLYVGNLHPKVSTELLQRLFSLQNPIRLCRVVADKATHQSLGFGFIDYHTRAAAEQALKEYAGANIYDRVIMIDWAHGGAGAAGGGVKGNGKEGDEGNGGNGKEDTSNHFCLFVGNLSEGVDDVMLREAFGKFGGVSSAKVSKGEAGGYGFVSFREKSDAEGAIEGLNEMVLEGKALRVDWAKTKTNAVTRAAALGLPEPRGGNLGGRKGGRLDFESVKAQTVVTNVTAYVAGLPLNVTEDVLREAMETYGDIYEVRIPESVRSAGVRGDRVYAFVRFRDHDSAAKAIFECQDGKVIAGRDVTVQWGRESTRRGSMMGAGPPRMYHQQQQHQAYGYGQGGAPGYYGGGSGYPGYSAPPYQHQGAPYYTPHGNGYSRAPYRGAQGSNPRY